MAHDGRLRKLEASIPRPDPEAEAREENFLRGCAILAELECHVPLGERGDADHLLETAVSQGLAKYGLSQEEIDEVGPDYVAQFKDMLREIGAEAS